VNAVFGLARVPVGAVAGLVVGFALGLLLAALAPFVVGHKTFTVMSGSMEPAIRTGDLVVDERIRPLEARVGDVVSFDEPGPSRRLVTHRVRSVRADGAQVRFVTKGDANNTVERWSAPAAGQIGRVVYRIPKLGYALAYFRTPFARIALLVIPALALAIYELVRLWRPERDPEVGDEAAA
jgi:signal peptidase